MDEERPNQNVELNVQNEECRCDNCKQSRFRSKAAWASLLALLGLLLGTFGVYEVLGISGTQYEKISEMLLSTMVAFGILNNPTDKNSF